MSTRVLKDFVLREILSHLNLREKSKLINVSKQFESCVNELLKREIHLTFVLSYIENLNIIGKCDLIIKGKRAENLCHYSNEKPVLDLDMNDIRPKYEPLFKKFENLNVIQIGFMAVNKQFFLWINEVFPQIKDIRIIIPYLLSRKWFIEEFNVIKECFGNKIQGLDLWLIPEFDAIIESKILELESLRFIKIVNCLKAEPSPDILKNLSKSLIQFEYKGISGLNEDNIIALSEQNRNNLKILKINFDDKSDSNEILEKISNNFVKLEILELSCGSLNSLAPIENLENLRVLRIYLTNGSLIDFSSMNSMVSKLEIRGEFKLKPQAFENFENSFPNISHLMIEGFIIKCKSRYRHHNCLNCIKHFLHLCSKANKKDSTLKRFKLNFRTNHIKDVHRIILMSILTEYLDSEHHFKVDIKSKGMENCVNCLMDIIMLSHIKSDIIITFKIDSKILEQILKYKNLIPENVRLDSDKNRSKFSGETQNTNESMIYIKQISQENDVLKWISVYFGDRKKSIKNIFLSINL